MLKLFGRSRRIIQDSSVNTFQSDSIIRFCHSFALGAAFQMCFQFAFCLFPGPTLVCIGQFPLDADALYHAAGLEKGEDLFNKDDLKTFQAQLSGDSFRPRFCTSN